MNRSRDNNRGPAYDQWVIDRAAEVAEEQRQQAEAQAAADAADPVKAFQKSVNMLAEEIRTAILTGQRLTDDVLQIEHVQGRSVNEDVAVQNVNWWANNQGRAAGFQNYMFSFLYDFVKVNDGSPTAETFQKCFQLLKDYNCLPEAPVAQPVITEVVAEPVLTPREASIKKFNDDRTIVVVTDPETGREYTEHMLSLLDSVTERRLRRIAENRIGSSNFETYLDVKTAQFERDQEIARRAAEEAQQ